MDKRTRKVRTMHRTFHSRDDVDRRYASRKEGGRGHASVEDASIQRLEDNIKKHKGSLITATINNRDNTRID